MTEQEDNALSIFCRMVAELNDAQLTVTALLESEELVDRMFGALLDGWLDTIRAGESQESLNGLVIELIAQEDPENA